MARLRLRDDPIEETFKRLELNEPVNFTIPVERQQAGRDQRGKRRPTVDLGDNSDDDEGDRKLKAEAKAKRVIFYDHINGSWKVELEDVTSAYMKPSEVDADLKEAYYNRKRS